MIYVVRNMVTQEYVKDQYGRFVKGMAKAKQYQSKKRAIELAKCAAYYYLQQPAIPAAVSNRYNHKDVYTWKTFPPCTEVVELDDSYQVQSVTPISMRLGNYEIPNEPNCMVVVG